MIRIFLSLLFISGLLSGSLSAQHTLSFGIKPSVGIPLSVSKPTLKTENKIFNMVPGLMYHGGAVLQYLYKDKCGIEIAADPSFQGFTIKDGMVSRAGMALGLSAQIENLNFKFPVAAIWKVKVPSEPYFHFKFVGGIVNEINRTYFEDYHMQATVFENSRNTYMFSYNIAGRLCFDNLRMGRAEISLGYLLPSGKTDIAYTTLRGIPYEINYKLHYLVFGVYLFFYNSGGREKTDKLKGNLLSFRGDYKKYSF